MDDLVANSIASRTPIPQFRRVSLKNQKALIAMSNRQLAESVSDFLKDLNIGELHVTSSCMEAVRLIDTHDFSLCYVGYALEQMGGPDFVKFIRTAETKTQQSFVTMLIPNPTKDRIRESRDAGVHEILGLPITKRLLGERMLAMLLNSKPWVDARGYRGPCRRTEQMRIYHGEDRRQCCLPDNENTPECG